MRSRCSVTGKTRAVSERPLTETPPTDEQLLPLAGSFLSRCLPLSSGFPSLAYGPIDLVRVPTYCTVFSSEWVERGDGVTNSSCRGEADGTSIAVESTEVLFSNRLAERVKKSKGG